MNRVLRPIKSSYFLFYAVTFCGSALTSVSSFLMIERLTGSMLSLSVALALRTAFSALASPLVATALAHISLRTGLIQSQLFGLLLLAPLYLGVKLQTPAVFIAGITIGGLSTLILNIAGTAHLKLASDEANEDFRGNQGQLQLIIGVAFTACSLLAPFLLHAFSYEQVLAIDALTYLSGLAFVLLNRSVFDRGRPLTAPATSDSATPAIRGPKFNQATIIFTLIAASAYALKGLAPMLSGNASLTSHMTLDVSARQSLWAYEALAGIIAGLVYKRFHARLNGTMLSELGVICAALLLPITFFDSYAVLALSVFAVSLSMLLTFMKYRDDFLNRFTSKNDAVWAAGYVNLVSNCILTISPILISLALYFFSFNVGLSIALACQIGIYLHVVTLKKLERR